MLVSAFLLVEEGNWGYSTLWIELGFLGFLFSFMMGALFLGSGWSRVGRLFERDGVDSPEVHAWIRLMLIGSWLDLGVLLAVLFVMTTKPAPGEAGALVVAAAIPVACTVIPFALIRAKARRTPEAEVATEGTWPGA